MVNIEILTQKGEKVKASSDALSGVIGRSLRLWRGSSDSDAS
ncbi:hypothetical protein [Ruminococcus sp.]